MHKEKIENYIWFTKLTRKKVTKNFKESKELQLSLRLFQTLHYRKWKAAVQWLYVVLLKSVINRQTT